MQNISPSHSFNVELACQYGIEEALIIQHFQIWINHNKRMGQNWKDDRTWSYQTREKIAAHFPYMNADQVRRLTDKLVDLKVLRKGSFNKKGFDKTIWYAFENEELFTIGNFAKWIGESAKPSGNFATPIPETKTETKPEVFEVNEGSLTSSIEEGKKKSSYKGLAKLLPSQQATLSWLQGLNINTDADTLSWWARKYSFERLLEVYEEAKKRSKTNLAGYMNRLLGKDAILMTGRVAANHEICKQYKAEMKWGALEIHNKYAMVKTAFGEHEIDFNMESLDFYAYLSDKYQQLMGN